MDFYNKIKLIATGILIIIVINSCTDDFEEMNIDPKLVSEDLINTDHLLAKVLTESVFDIFDKAEISEWAGQNKSQWGNNALELRDWDFSNIYTTDLINISEVIRFTEEDPLLSNKNAIAKIWKVWIFHRITDRWGDVPYFEAALGSQNVILSPKYDTQEIIYKDMLNTLKGAAAQLQPNNDELTSSGISDILYGGDAALWQRFANSLRLRLAMRVRFVDRELAQTHINDVINAPLIDELSQNASVLTEGVDAADQNNTNPLDRGHYWGGQPRDGFMAFTQHQELLKRDDPRLEVYWLENPTTGEYRGWPLNMGGDQLADGYYAKDSCNQYGDWFEQPEITINILTSYEVKYLKAEAALYGLISGDPNTFVQQGIQEGLTYYEVDQAEIDTYLANWGTLQGTDEEKFEEIIVQKYLSMNHQPQEGWTEFRRTGYPKIWVGSEPGVTNGEIPRRHNYPDSEGFKNSENLSEAVGRLPGGIDDMMAKVWWDKNPLVPIYHEKQGQYPPEIY